MKGIEGGGSLQVQTEVHEEYMELKTIKDKHREAMKYVIEGDMVLEENGQNNESLKKAIENYELAYEIEASIAKTFVELHPDSNWRSIACLSAASLAWRCGNTDLAKIHINEGLKNVQSYITKEALYQLLNDIENNVKFFKLI